MPRGLPEQLSTVLAEGQREAERTLLRFAASEARLQSREWIFPMASSGLHGAQTRCPAVPNRLIHGTSMSAAAALLTGDAGQPSLRGQIGLILIDPHQETPADSGHHADNIAARLAVIVPRLVLMQGLLSRTGSIYIRLDELVMPYIEMMVDNLFGPTISVHAFTGGHGAGPATAEPSDEVLDAIILVVSDRHTLVADFLGDCGRGAIAAARYGRRWIAADNDHAVCQVMRRRLQSYGTEPFLYQSIA